MGELLKLHLGCGRVRIPGFVHVDLGDYPHVDHRCDARALPMFGDGAASLVYASHVLEYFDWTEAVDVLREWRRVLAPGGTLRLSVPNFEALAELYRKTGSLTLIVGSLYGRWEAGEGTIYHRMAYDFATLSTVLRLAGFRCVRRWDWRETEHAGIDDCSQAYYPHMDKENGMLLSLNVEADK